jgi:hypothetical protein
MVASRIRYREGIRFGLLLRHRSTREQHSVNRENSNVKGVKGLADLCLAPEGQTGNPAVAELETHHAELQSRTHPNYAGGP